MTTGDVLFGRLERVLSMNLRASKKGIENYNGYIFLFYNYIMDCEKFNYLFNELIIRQDILNKLILRNCDVSNHKKHNKELKMIAKLLKPLSEMMLFYKETEE